MLQAPRPLRASGTPTLEDVFEIVTYCSRRCGRGLAASAMAFEQRDGRRLATSCAPARPSPAGAATHDRAEGTFGVLRYRVLRALVRRAARRSVDVSTSAAAASGAHKQRCRDWCWCRPPAGRFDRAEDALAHPRSRDGQGRRGRARRSGRNRRGHAVAVGKDDERCRASERSSSARQAREKAAAILSGAALITPLLRAPSAPPAPARRSLARIRGDVERVTVCRPDQAGMLLTSSTVGCPSGPRRISTPQNAAADRRGSADSQVVQVAVENHRHRPSALLHIGDPAGGVPRHGGDDTAAR